MGGEYILAIALVAGAILFAGLPLFRQPRSLPQPSSDRQFEELAARKENAYEAIQELEFDLQMGKLSREDYEALRAQYSVEAVDCLKAMDALAGGVSTERDALFCPDCGHARASAERFCSQCGNKLVPVEK